MLGADAYRPDQWHDFFITVGPAAAVLTGLVFVALSLNLAVVIPDATHTEADFAQAVHTLEDPTVTIVTPMTVAAWGTRT
jgi:hypothetical protein